MQKCSHGVYKPDGDPIALSCQACNPDGTGEGSNPVLPRSSSDPLNSTNRTEKLETCDACGCVRTYSTTDCQGCGRVFPLDSSRGRVQDSANAHAAGTCPECGSAVHYETTKSKKWVCADCDAEYPAPKRVKHNAN